MKKRKEVATEQKFELLEKRVSQLEDNTRQLKNKLYTEIYAWKHNRKEALEKLSVFNEIIKENSLVLRVMVTLRSLAHLCIVLWTVGWLFSWLFS